MTPDEELAALRRLAALQGAGEVQVPLSMKLGAAKDTLLENLAHVGRGAANLGADIFDAFAKPIPIPFTDKTVAVTPPQMMAKAIGLGGAGEAVRRGAERAFPIDPNEDLQHTLARKALEGAPSALLWGPVAAGRGLAASMTGPMVGELAERFAGEKGKGIVPEGGEKIVGGLANALTQLPFAVASPQGGRYVTQGIDKAFGRKFELPEEKVARDTGILTNIALNRVGPKTSPAQGANMAEEGATKFFKGLEDSRSRVYGDMVKGVDIPKAKVQDIYLSTHMLADEVAKTGRADQADALRAVADKLLTGIKKPKTFITDLQDLSLNIKSLKENPVSPRSAPGTKIPDADVRGAIESVENMLKEISPDFQRANDAFAYTSRWIDATAKEPIGKLANKTPYTPDPAAPGKLTAIIQGAGPAQIDQTMAALKAQGVPANRLARALAEQKLQGGGLSPGQRLFGGPGSGVEEQMNALLRGAGVDSASVKAPLEAADTLARTLPNQGMVESGSMHLNPPGMNFRLSKPNFMMGAEAKALSRQQVKDLLATASPEEFAQLRRMAMFDPSLRKLLSTVSALSAFQQSKD